MKRKILSGILCLMGINAVMSQNKTIKLEEVIVTDKQLSQFSNSKILKTINDSVIQNHGATLGNLLQFSTPIFLKENGNGMVSSASFRGTTAQQTAVIWNGININSQLNGQVDFNSIPNSGFQQIVVRPGGGSVVYGSSAIGGSIHLNNEMRFVPQNKHLFQIRAGSFDTYLGAYQNQISTKKEVFQVNISRFQSKNNFPILKTNLFNENGEIEQTQFQFNSAFKLSEKHQLKWFSQMIDGKRNFSDNVGVVGNSKYEDFNSRMLLEWQYASNKFVQKTKLVYLHEKNIYFYDKNSNSGDESKVNSYIIKEDFLYKISNNIQLNAVLDYTKANVSGLSLETSNRDIFSGVLLFKHQPIESLKYEISVRQEKTTGYQSPFLYSFGTEYNLNKHFAFKANLSKNFRIPSFNDLFWIGSGNKDLKPETALQKEIGLVSHWKNGNLQVQYFHNNMDQLIAWQPDSSGNWKPFNINKAKSEGIEMGMEQNFKLFSNPLQLQFQYAFTDTKDLQTEKNMVYTPKNKFTGSLGYQYQKIGIVGQYLYNGSVYTNSSNTSDLKDYQIMNLELQYFPFKNQQTRFSVKVQNVLNTYYESVALRPMPGRNVSFQLIYQL